MRERQELMFKSANTKNRDVMHHKERLNQAETAKNRRFCLLTASASVIFHLTMISVLNLPAIATAAGKTYSPQGTRLTKAINDALLSKGLCQTPRQCHDMLPGTLETDSKVLIQFFNVSELNHPALSAAVALTLSDGTKITEGVPITVEAFRESHDEYRKSGIFFKGVKPFVTLDVSH